MYVRDLADNEYALQATLTHDLELNGNQAVSCTIYASKANKAFIDNITEMWTLVDFDDVEHKIIYAKKKGEGNSLTIDVKAIPLFFDVFDTLRIYEEYNEHMTAQLAFTRIFDDTGFSFVLVDSFEAVQWQGFGGGESRLETFKRALERYKAEFRIAGNTVYLESLIGRDTQFQYRYRLNASNIVQENDASALWTYAKGYGDYDEGGEEEGGWENANLIREYTSPLASIIGIRHAPPIKDGRITDQTTMNSALKEIVDESLKISVSADIHDLRRQGYELAQPELGDRVFLIDERIGLDEEVRIVDISITRNWKGDVIDLNLTFGSEGVTKRHQARMNTAIKNITEVFEGRRKLPASVLDDAVLNATSALKRMQTELAIPENGGLMAVDVNNPNNVVVFNAAGIGVSDDGGATYKNSITGEGVVAETIVGQSIIGVNLSSIDETGYFHVNGSDAEFFDTSTNRRVELSPNGLFGYNADNSLRFRADSTLVSSAALGTVNTNVYLAASPSSEHGAEARVVDFRDIPGDGLVGSYRYHPLRALGFFGNYLAVNQGGTAGVNLYLNPAEGGEVRVTARSDASTYRAIRASGFYGAFLDPRPDGSGSNIYLRPKSGGEARVTRTGTVDEYLPIRADGYLNAPQSIAGTFSLLSIPPSKNEATEIIKSIDLMRYTEGNYPVFKITVANSAVTASEGAMDLSKTLEYVVKAIQEIDDRLLSLEGVS